MVALKDCYYGEKRRRPGDVFELTSEQHFNPRRMQWNPKAALRTTTTGEHLQREHDQILGMKYASRRGGIQAGDDSVPANVPEGEDNPLGDSFGE